MPEATDTPSLRGRITREIAGFLASVVNPQSDHAVMGQSMAVVEGETVRPELGLS